MHVRRYEFLDRGCFEGNVPRQCVVERPAQAVHIRQGRLPLALDFFRSDIIGCAPSDILHFLIGLGAPGQAKIHQFGLVVGVEEDIAGFDVAVQEIVLEGHVEGGGDLDADVQHFQLRNAGLLLDLGVETAAVRQFHHEIPLPLPLVERVDVNDVRVVERGAGARFAIKIVERLLVAQQLFLHQLHRHHSSQRGVHRAIHGSHAA